jgi:hypothetical protein
MSKILKLIKVLNPTRFILKKEKKDKPEKQNKVDFQMFVYENEEDLENEEPKEVIY